MKKSLLATAILLAVSAGAQAEVIYTWTDTKVPTLTESKFEISAKDLKKDFWAVEVGGNASGQIKDVNLAIDALGAKDGKSQDVQIIGFEVNGGNIDLSGKSFDIAIKTDFVGENYNQSPALDIYATGAKTKLSADTVNLSVESLAKNGKAIYGIALNGKKEGSDLEITSKTVNISLSTATERTETYGSEAIGIDIANGKLTALSKDSIFFIDVNSTAEAPTANGKNFASSAYGVKFEGGKGSIEGTIDATVNAIGGNAIGVAVTNYYENSTLGQNWNDSAADLNNVKVTAFSKESKAAGIDVSYVDGKQNSVILNINGESNLSSTTENGTAYGISVTGNTTVAINGNLTASATATGKGDAYSLYLSEGKLSVSGTNTILNGDVAVENQGLILFGASQTARSANSVNVVMNGNMAVDSTSSVIFNQTEMEVGTGGSVDIQGTLQSSQSVITINEMVTDKPVVNIANLSDKSTLGISASSSLTDTLGGDIEAFAEGISVQGAGASNTTLVMKEGLVSDGGSASLDKDGALDKSTVVKNKNTLMQSTLELASAAPLALNRIMMNDVRKRLGDIRTTEGTHGAWARYDGGKLSGEGGLENDFHTVQVGIDTVPTADSARMGVAFSYTDSDAEYARGSADMKAYSIAMYGTKVFDNGMFVDVIGRMGTADSDLTVDGQHKGTLDNVVLGVSGEFGWRFDVTNSMYIEPQAELSYAYVNGDKLTLGTAEYDVDSVNSLLGRVGFAAGLKCPSDMGNVYVRASAVHEFLGDSKITGANAGHTNVYEIDGKDTWVEYGLGANFNVTKSTYMWADVERTSGGALDEDWRATVGVRYAW